ncbi:hypothetical protein PLANTIT3_50292 [Plantibacter sp. T3]|nr:hypothetical protein PLANTIT3_50292 [Plantibacter sp. T3]
MRQVDAAEGVRSPAHPDRRHGRTRRSRCALDPDPRGRAPPGYPAAEATDAVGDDRPRPRLARAAPAPEPPQALDARRHDRRRRGPRRHRSRDARRPRHGLPVGRAAAARLDRPGARAACPHDPARRADDLPRPQPPARRPPTRAVDQPRARSDGRHGPARPHPRRPVLRPARRRGRRPGHRRRDTLGGPHPGRAPGGVRPRRHRHPRPEQWLAAHRARRPRRRDRPRRGVIRAIGHSDIVS